MKVEFQRYRAKLIGGDKNPKASIQKDSVKGTMYLVSDVKAYFKHISTAPLEQLTLDETAAYLNELEDRAKAAEASLEAVRKQLSEAIYISGAINTPLTEQELAELSTQLLIEDLIAANANLKQDYDRLKASFADAPAPAPVTVEVQSEDFTNLKTNRDYWHGEAQRLMAERPWHDHDKQQLQSKYNMSQMILGNTQVLTHRMARYVEYALKSAIEYDSRKLGLIEAIANGIVLQVRFDPNSDRYYFNREQLTEGDLAYTYTEEFETVLSVAKAV